MPTKTAEARTITIPQLRTARLRVRVEGITPLITHAFSAAAMAAMEAAQQGAARVKKAPRQPQAEYEASIYHTPDGRPAIPAIAIKRAMATAGQRFAGEKATELFGAFSIPAELLEIEGSAPAMRSDRVVLSGIGRVSSVAYRAQFSPWALSVPLVLNADFISPDQAVNLLRLAGFSVGIGDWRVERRGSFGQFGVVSVEAE